MLKFVLCFIFIVQAAFAAKLTLDERRKKILSIINEELNEVSRLARSQDYGSPDTLLRLSELYLEKARLYREVENEEYLSIPPEQRRGVDKRMFYKTSRSFFDDANNTAHKIVRRFKGYKGLNEVYYILAYNYKELGEHDDAQKYFKLSSKGNSNDQTNLKAKLNLADYYYNDHNYKEAIPLYEGSINQLNEKWWTKDSFNLAWSYYRTKRYDKAINLMKEVYRRSGDSKYIDMKSNVERDIGIFYVDAGRLKDAIRFYEDLNLSYTDQFVKIANALTSQGRFTQAESLLEQAEKNEKDPSKRAEILLGQLSLYDKFNKIPQHISAARELVAINKKTPLDSEQLAKVSYQINKKAAELQKVTASDSYKTAPNVRKQKADQAIVYFELSSQLNPGQKDEKVFFQGETAYATGEYDKAIKLYLAAFDGAQAKNDKKIMGQTMEGLLSSLANMGEKNAEKYYEPVYSRYLNFDSKSDKANSIYVKLFKVQYDNKDISAAEATLKNFAKNFPKDLKTQEAMLAKIMEHYRAKKDYAAVKSYINRINDGEFKVSKKYSDALKSLITKIQIEGVQQSLEKGDKAVALKGYHQIYENSESTDKAKTNAAYNLAALYYEIGDSSQSYKWGSIAIKQMDVADVTKFSDSFLSIASGLFLRQQFSSSADMSHKLLAKLCKENSSNKPIAFKNAVFISLANNDIEKALEIKNSGKNCSIPENTISEVSFEILKDLGKAKRWEAVEELIKELESNPRNHAALIKPYEDLRREYASIGQNDDAREVANKQMRYFEQARKQKVEVPVEALDLIADRMIASLVDKKRRFDQLELAFPEANFNAAVKGKLQLLDQMTSEVNNIQKIGSGKGIVEAYRIVIEAYESFGNGLKAFTPEGKEEAYLASFRKAMADVHGPILANAKKQRAEIKRLIVDNKILSQANYAVLYSDLEKMKRFITEKESVLMERGGRK